MPISSYVSVSIHELGHAIFGFEHSATGIMYHRMNFHGDNSTLRFNSEQQNIIKKQYMGKLIRSYKFLVVLFFLFASIVLLRYSNKDIRYKIYFSEYTKPFFNRIIGIVPNNYENLFEEKIIEEADAHSLINVVNKGMPFYSNDIIFYDKSAKKEKFIKAYPISLFRRYSKNEVFDFANEFSQQINLDIFNKYSIDKNKISSKEEIFRKLCYLLSIPEDNSSFRIIINGNDLNDLILSLNIKESDKKIVESNGDKVINSGDEVNFDKSYFYCWFKNFGLVKSDLNFDDNSLRLIQIKSEIIGYLGNEEATMG